MNFTLLGVTLINSKLIFSYLKTCAECGILRVSDVPEKWNVSGTSIEVPE